MRAAIFERFGGPIEVRDVPDPIAAPGEVVVAVRTVGLCRSDLHGWKGTDPDIVCPHIGGHEFVGDVVEVGAGVQRVHVGDRIVVPFVCGCGQCEPCRLGQHQVCRRQEQPGFTRWGAFAEYTTIPFADVNAVVVPAELDDTSAALIGCRVSTAYRGVIERGRTSAGEMVVVFGCGGVGLAAIAFAKSQGAVVIAVDIAEASLDLAKAMGADHCLNANSVDDVATEIHARFGGTHVSIDCLGNAAIATTGVMSLRPLGRYVQIGLFSTPSADWPIGRVIRDELEVLGVHGLSASRFDPIIQLVTSGKLDLGPMIAARLGLDDLPTALPAMASFASAGVSVVEFRH